MIEWILSSSVLIAVVLALRWVLKGKLSLRLQYALWGLVLLRLLVPVSVGNSAISVENWTKKAADSAPGQFVSILSETELPRMSFKAAYNEVAREYADRGIRIEDMSLEEYAATVDYEIMNKMNGGLSVAEVVKIIWIGGIALMGAWFLLTNLRMRRSLRKNRTLLDDTRALPVYVSDAVETPCFFGLFRPAVYLTKDTAENEVATRHAVEHELTHYRHKDHIWAILRCVCLAVHWYHPLVWCAAVCARNDSELACDEATIRRLGEDERAAYGRTLIGLTCEKRTALLNTATTMTGSGRRIRERITLIVKKPKMAAYTAVAVMLIAVLAVGCTFTGADVGADDTDGVTVYQCGDLSAAISSEYAEELIVCAGGDTGEESVLLKVYGRTATEAFAAADLGANDEVGWLFSIVRWDQARYEAYLGEDGSGADVFARDDTWYYVCIQSTDSTFYPTGDMADQERWEVLWSTLPAAVREDFITRNSLTAWNAKRTQEDLTAELLAAAYQEAQAFGVDLDLSQVQLQPLSDTEYDVTFTVKNTDTCIWVRVSRMADGTWAAVK